MLFVNLGIIHYVTKLNSVISSYKYNGIKSGVSKEHVPIVCSNLNIHLKCLSEVKFEHIWSCKKVIEDHVVDYFFLIEMLIEILWVKIPAVSKMFQSLCSNLDNHMYQKQ
jgi:hypothetical protein